MDIDLSSWRYYRGRYHTIAGAIDAGFPKLVEDPDVALALATIRNAERAIEARVSELSGEDDGE